MAMIFTDLINIFVAQFMTLLFDIIRSLLGMGAATAGA
jgi:hypothetical protein